MTSVSSPIDPSLLGPSLERVVASLEATTLSPELVEHEAQVDLPEKPGVEGLLTLLRRVLSKRFLQEIHIRKKQPVRVRWYGPEKDTLDIEPPQESPSKQLQHLDFRMLVDTGEGSFPPAALILGTALLAFERTGLCLSYALVGPSTLLYRWLGDSSLRTRLAGGLLLEDRELPDHVLLLVAGATPFSALQDAAEVLLISMEVPREP